MTLRNRELLVLVRHFLSLLGTFLHSLNVIKWGKPSQYKFALNSIFTILALATFFLSTAPSVLIYQQ